MRKFSLLESGPWTCILLTNWLGAEVNWSSRGPQFFYCLLICGIYKPKSLASRTETTGAFSSGPVYLLGAGRVWPKLLGWRGHQGVVRTIGVAAYDRPWRKQLRNKPRGLGLSAEATCGSCSVMEQPEELGFSAPQTWQGRQHNNSIPFLRTYQLHGAFTALPDSPRPWASCASPAVPLTSYETLGTLPNLSIPQHHHL